MASALSRPSVALLASSSSSFPSFSSASPAPSSLSSLLPLVRLTSLTRRHAELPSDLQPAFTELTALHSALDVALAELDQAASVAQINAQTTHIKQLLAQLQQRLTQLQSQVHGNDAPALPSSSGRPSESTGERDLAYASSLLSQHSALCASYSNQLRQRILSSRASLAQRSSDVRRQLLSSATSSAAKAAVREEDTQRRFTASLNATHELLNSSLQLSTASLSSLTSSTSTLRDVQRQSTAYTGVVKGGSQVITKQMQRARTDRLLILVGLLFFTLVCLYIVNKRLRISRMMGMVASLLPSLNTGMTWGWTGWRGAAAPTMGLAGQHHALRGRGGLPGAGGAAEAGGGDGLHGGDMGNAPRPHGEL